MKFLLLLLQEMFVAVSSSSSCELKCSWKIFNWDDSIATVTSSGHSSGGLQVIEAFDGNNETVSILLPTLYLNQVLRVENFNLKSFKDTRWHNSEVESGNNFIEITFKKIIMVKSFSYLAGLNGGSYVTNYK